MSGPLPVRQTFSVAPSHSDRESQEQKLREAAEMYERHFLNEMVKAMRKTVPEGEGVLPGTFAEKIYRDQLDQQYVESWSQVGGVGLGQLIFDQLKEKFGGGPIPLNAPRGPLPTAPTKEGALPIEMRKSLSPNGALNLQFKGLPTLNGGKIAVTSPWSGELREAFSTDEGRVKVKIQHVDGLESILNYQGAVSTWKSGEKVAAGQEVGWIDPAAAQLTWTVTKNGSPRA